jgi:membrane protein insertase Oxa1/YidC/SpoIIIJ
MMELYKKEKVNPVGSCGFLLIQMPILFVLYHVILKIQDPSNAFHLYSFLSDYDVTTVSYQFFGIDLLGAG